MAVLDEAERDPGHLLVAEAQGAEAHVRARLGDLPGRAQVAARVADGHPRAGQALAEQDLQQGGGVSPVRGDRQARAQRGAGGGDQAAFLARRRLGAPGADLADDAGEHTGPVHAADDLLHEEAGEGVHVLFAHVRERLREQAGRGDHRHPAPGRDPGQGGGVAAHAQAGQFHHQAEPVIRLAQLPELGGDGALLVEPAVRVGVDADRPAHVGAQVLVGEYGALDGGGAYRAGDGTEQNVGHNRH